MNFFSRSQLIQDYLPGTMKDVNVTSIVPVDLNSLLCVNARTLSHFYYRLGNYNKQKHYARIADEKNETMSKIFWDQTDGIWYDYDLNAKSRRRLVLLTVERFEKLCKFMKEMSGNNSPIRMTRQQNTFNKWNNFRKVEWLHANVCFVVAFSSIFLFI